MPAKLHVYIGSLHYLRTTSDEGLLLPFGLSYMLNGLLHCRYSLEESISEVLMTWHL